MGYAISWLAVRNRAQESVLASIGLVKTGQTEEIPESDWCSKQVGEWTVVWSNSFQPSKFRNAAAKIKGEVVVFDIEEHVMFASVSAFHDGHPSWRIEHDAQESADHLSVEGNPPECLDRIRAEQFARVPEDPEVDFVIDIPVRIAQEAVGFRYDEALNATFDVCSETKSKWSFW